MGEVSTLLVLGAMAAYVVAMAAFAVDISGRGPGASVAGRRRAAGVGMTTTTLGLGLHLVGLVLRGVAAGRVPWANMYEFTLAFTFVVIAVFVGVQRRRDIRYLGVFVTLIAVSALMLAILVLYVEADGVQPALDSYWLAIHVSVAAASTGLFAVSAVASALQLVRHRHPLDLDDAPELVSVTSAAAGAAGGEGAGTMTGTARAGADAPGRGGAGVGGGEVGGDVTPPRGALGRLLSQLPDEVTLERIAYRLNAVAFVGWTFTLIAGAIWAEHAWGRPWGWDPKETWTLVIWLIYASYLHVRATAGWATHKFAYFALVGFVALMVNFYVVNIFFSGNHSYAGV